MADILPPAHIRGSVAKESRRKEPDCHDSWTLLFWPLVFWTLVFWTLDASAARSPQDPR